MWASEIEKFPMAVTMHRFPEMKHMGDITKLHGENLPVVDVIAGVRHVRTYPLPGDAQDLRGCVPVSLEQVRIIKEMRRQEERRKNSSGRRADVPVRPRYMVWENVPGAFSSGEPKGADFKRVLEEVCGISEESVSLPGPPDGAWTPAGIILGQEFSVAWRVLDAQFWESPRDAEESSLSQILEATVPERYYLSPKACGGIIRRAGNRGKKLPPILEAAL